MNFSQKQSIAAIVFLSIALLLSLIVFTDLFHKKPKESFFKNIHSDMYLKNIIYYLNQKGLRGKIRAQNARWFQKKALLVLKDINATIIKDSSSPIYITALQGYFNTRKGLLTLKDKVNIKKQDTIIRTSLLFFNSKKKIMFTNKPVKIVSQGLSLNGTGMTYNLKTGKLVVRHQHSTIKQVR